MLNRIWGFWADHLWCDILSILNLRTPLSPVKVLNRIVIAHTIDSGLIICRNGTALRLFRDLNICLVSFVGCVIGSFNQPFLGANLVLKTSQIFPDLFLNTLYSRDSWGLSEWSLCLGEIACFRLLLHSILIVCSSLATPGFVSSDASGVAASCSLWSSNPSFIDRHHGWLLASSCWIGVVLYLYLLLFGYTRIKLGGRQLLLM